MKLKGLSFTFHTEKIKECVDFYIHAFGARVVFDCGWYVTVMFQSDSDQGVFLSFIKPEYGTADSAFSGGVTLNMGVDDVDAEYIKIREKGMTVDEEIADHDWGDRAFSVKDPVGNVLYIYSEREIGDKYKDAIIDKEFI